VRAQPFRQVVIVVLIALVISCVSRRPSQITGPDGRITLTLWSATNAQEVEFANQMAAEWNARQTIVHIKVEPVPSGQSSEEVILAAIASNTTPDIYANV